MKKIVFALMVLVAMSSCSVDDDASNTSYELAEITGNSLPDEFVFGETYSIEIDYLLPSECNSFVAVDARRAGSTSQERTQIYIGAVTTVNNSANCDPNVSGNEGSSNFSITIDEDEDYTFYFWTGIDANDRPIYTEVVVPVAEIIPSEN